MSAISDWLLTALLNNGSALLGLAMFLAALGIPLPATMLLIAAGGMAQQGVLSLQGALLSAAAGAIAGDAGGYLLGRFGFRLLQPRVAGSPQWSRAVRLFARWGALGVFVTRFLFTPLSMPVNLLAGSTGYAWRRFMAAVLAGEAIWVLLYAGLGHQFAGQWVRLSEWAAELPALLWGGLLVSVGALLLTARRWRA